MPSSAQIAAATVLTRERAFHLLEIVRASDAYAEMLPTGADIEDVIFALVDVADSASDEGIKSRMLDANLTALDTVIKEGTVGVKGGAKGADYSKSRDREEIVRRVLGLLYSGVSIGSNVTFTTGGSWNLQNVPVW